jgi:hypothetical protein
MRQFSWVRVSAVAGVMLLSLGWAQPSDARKPYHELFVATYPNLAAKAGEAKCNVCHFGDAKKNRNNYGEAMVKALDGKKNLKAGDPDMAKALKAMEGEKSAEAGKTFGDLIKADTLPGKNP